MSFVGSPDRAIHLDLYDLYEIGIALLVESVRRMMRLSRDNSSMLSAHAVLLCVIIWSSSCPILVFVLSVCYRLHFFDDLIQKFVLFGYICFVYDSSYLGNS